ncbi:hypothetical protein [Sediminibacillus terrae]|uniref:hypothetical protein n=1 Tax=Sediminibacillus terrae TaxID=1562106 RepID=UPI0012952FA9|nr:hypothetical protein [Sediminibacillus terrae]
MNRAERRRTERAQKKQQYNNFEELPRFAQQHQENMAAALVTAAIQTLAEEFDFNAEDLSKFNEGLQHRAERIIKVPERG